MMTTDDDDDDDHTAGDDGDGLIQPRRPQSVQWPPEVILDNRPYVDKRGSMGQISVEHVRVVRQVGVTAID